MNVKDKLVIITGSSQGLGKAFAVVLLEAGASVCLSDVNPETGENALSELGAKYGERVHFIKCDVLVKEDIVNLYEGCESHFGKTVDIFCNNAGINHARGWKLCMDIDIMAVIECTEYVLDKMDMRKGGKGGLIVNTASLAGIGAGLSRESVSYFVAKHGVVSLTRTLGTTRFLADTGVKVQCICPAFADTAIIKDVGKYSAFTEAVKKFGVMTPEYVADGFFKLVTRCKTGDALVVVKDVPPFIYVDYSREWTMVLAAGSKIFNSLFGVDLFTPHLQIIFLLFIFLFFHILMRFIF